MEISGSMSQINARRGVFRKNSVKLRNFALAFGRIGHKYRLEFLREIADSGLNGLKSRTFAFFRKLYKLTSESFPADSFTRLRHV